MLTYEQITPDDAFGRVMCDNLKRRGCDLKSLHRYPTLDAQKQRYRDAGWPTAQAATMLDIHNRLIPLDERRRVQRLEPLDEIEEWNLIQKHYTCVLADEIGDARLLDIDFNSAE